MPNPFDHISDPVRHDLWHRLVQVDSEAFAAGDWSRIADDFDAEHFEGIRCYTNNPDDWKIVFPRLEDYRSAWLQTSKEFRRKQFATLTHLEVVLRRARMDQIDIAGDCCIGHKKFSGTFDLADGTKLTGSRQTIYRLHQRGGRWKIVGFLGYLPLDEP